MQYIEVGGHCATPFLCRRRDSRSYSNHLWIESAHCPNDFQITDDLNVGYNRFMRRYLHERAEWPEFRWDDPAVGRRLGEANTQRGRLLAAMEFVGFDAETEAMLQVITQDVATSSAIEGETLDVRQVRSSAARRLGLDYAGLPKPARNVEGVVEMMLDATQRYAEPLDEARIFGWHSALFPTGRSGMTPITVGGWRDDARGPMQIVSGPMGRERVHYEAPAADRLPGEMGRFLNWFEGAPMDALLKAAIAHLWFETLHPLDDGNGRVGRAIMDLALARADQTPRRYYSVTDQIHRNVNSYYEVLERAQTGSLDVSEWVIWFLDRLDAALAQAEGALATARRRQAFWNAAAELDLNERQRKIIDLLFEGFKGKLQTSKYAKIAKCSAPTALRDLNDLLEKGVLVKEASGGRSTSYVLAPDYR